MDVSFINHFINSTANVFNMMLSCPITRTSLALKFDHEPAHEVSSVIGMSGYDTGSVVLSLSEELACRAAGQMLLDDFHEITAEVADAVGELSNMIAGGAKAQMAHLELQLGLPNVIVGRSHRVYFPGSVRPVSVGFATPWGPMAIDVGFESTLNGDLRKLNLRQDVAAGVR